MARSFSNPTFYNSGKPTFGNAFESDNAGDYLRNKKAKLLYRHNFNGLNFGGRLGSQNNYLLHQRSKVIRNETCETCPNVTSLNSSELVSGLYTTEKLGSSDLGTLNYNVNVVTDASYNESSCNIFQPTTIDKSKITSTTPFYWYYKIDPCGSLFGNTPCGYENYQDYRVISKPVITTAASLKDCCTPICFNLKGELVCDTICTYNNTPFIYNTTGNPTITNENGFTVLTFSSSGSFQFQHGVKNIGYIVVGGGGAGAGGDATGNGGGGGGGGGGIMSIPTDSLSLSPNITYTITIGTGGLGASNASGGAGAVSSISGISSASGGNGGVVGSNGNGGAGGVAVSGSGNGGDGYSDPGSTPPTNGSNGSTVTTNYGINYLLSSGGGGGGANAPGGEGTSSGGGAHGAFPGPGGGGQDGFSANYYGCGGGASSGDGRTGQGGPYTGGNGAPGVVIVWFAQ